MFKGGPDTRGDIIKRFPILIEINAQQEPNDTCTN